MAAVLAEVRDRDENLARVGDDAGPTGLLEPGIPHPACGHEQPVEVGAARVQQCLGLGRVECDSVVGAAKSSANRGGIRNECLNRCNA